jgi:DNA-binding NarL/FixJ family response regulator
MAQMAHLGTSEYHTKARVLIVDDQPVVRERLSQLISGESGLELCGDVDNASDAFELVEAKQPHLVVTGLALKGAHGLDFIKDLHLRYPHVRVLVFSMYDESLYAERAIRAGGNGFITKRERTAEVVHAIHVVLRDGIYLSERVTGEALRRVFCRRALVIGAELEGLSDRELEIFEFIGNGRSTAQIARALHLSVKTIETYRSRIKIKLRLNSGTQLVSRAKSSLRDIMSSTTREPI